MNVVGHYRKLLDELLNPRSLRPSASGTVHLDFTPNPAKTFNRGYSTYFLHGRGALIANPDTPKSLGEPLGKVTTATRRSFSLDPSAAPLHPGDGLCFLNFQRDLTGTTVNRVEEDQIFPADMKGLVPGVTVYRNHDHAFSEQLLKSQAARKIGLQFHLEATPDGLSLAASDEDHNWASFSLATELQPAQQAEKARETIERQLRKLGNTDFECDQVTIDLNPLPFLPVALINTLRRGAVEALAQAREQNRPRPAGGAIQNTVPFPQKVLSFEGNVLNQKAAEFYQRHGVEGIEPAAESGLDLQGRKVMTTQFCLRYELNACPRQPNPEKLSEPLKLVDEQNIEYPLRFNCAECVMEVYFRSLPE
jgi:putative protease